MTQTKLFALFGAGAVLASGLLILRAQEAADPAEDEKAEAVVEHPECAFFVRRDKFSRTEDARSGRSSRGDLTDQVVRLMEFVPSASRIKSFEDQSKFATIDQ